MQERRRYTRFPTEGKVVLKLKDGSARTIQSELVDINFAGMSVHSPQTSEAGIDVSFDLTINLWDQPIAGDGRIKYVKEIQRHNTVFRLGIEFVSVDKKIIRYIINRIQGEIAAETRKRKSF